MTDLETKLMQDLSEALEKALALLIIERSTSNSRATLISEKVCELEQCQRDRAELLERAGKLTPVPGKAIDYCDCTEKENLEKELAQAREQLAAAVKINAKNQSGQDCDDHCEFRATAGKYRELLAAVPRGFACDEETMHKLILERVKRAVGPVGMKLLKAMAAKSDDKHMFDMRYVIGGQRITYGDLRALKREMEAR